jgi:hypothetical protein
MTSPQHYHVGAATADITPTLDRTVYLAGFAPDRRAKGVLHPLEAGVLYVRDSQGSDLALVTLDLIGFLDPQVEQIRSRVAAVIDPVRLVVCSTHTHAGPDTLGIWGKALFGLIPYRSGVDPQYVSMVADRVADAVTRARDTASPSSLSAVTFDTPEDWVRNDRRGGGSYRRAVALVAREKGAVKAIMLNFAAHPETLWEKNKDVSPDYPAPFRSWLRRNGVGVPLFFSGPLGAMLTPNVRLKADTAERRQFVEELGEKLGRLTLLQAADAQPLSGPLKVAALELVLLNSNKRFEIAFRRGLIERTMHDNKVVTRMAAASIGDFSLVTVPGEACPEVGQQVFDVMGTGHRMVLCLGLDELGYIIPPEFFSKKEYRYEQSMSVGPHTAPGVLATASRLHARLAGQ